MKNSNLLKITLALALILSIFLPYSTQTTEAATTKTAFVNVSQGSTLSVRGRASDTAKKLGSLKNGVRVVVYSKNKSGFSEIRYKNKKAFVSTKYLKFANSYLQDISKVYTYMDMSNGEKSKHVYTGKSKYAQGWDEWSVDGHPSYDVYEDKDGLSTGYHESEIGTDMKYPIKKGKSWEGNFEGDGKVRITSVSKTVKTPAGTFKNCIEVTHDDGYTTYYAKNVGLVKTVYKGGAIYQLIKLENK